MTASEKRVVILGAAGRDFHNFNTTYRDDEFTTVVAFTATQIPDIEGRRYPPELSGPRYPQGIPILAEDELERIIERENVNTVSFAYSDVSHDYVMKLASRALAVGANFEILGTNTTMIDPVKPLISICAVRTGCGKSPTTRKVARLLRERGKTVAIIRHPMPYGDLAKQAVQRFATLEDMDTHQCTIEEREEYEHHINAGMVVFAGIDYERLLRAAEDEADVVIWDGGNNDMPFYRPHREIVVLDPHRAGHELTYFPGMVNFLRGDAFVINKLDSAPADGVATLEAHIQAWRPDATVIRADSALDLDGDFDLDGKRILAVEDGPTLTHGEMKLGAAVVAAQNHGATVVDPRPWLVGKLAETFEHYPDIGPLLPAMGYSEEQIADLAEVIKRAEVDAVVIGTPIDLSRLIEFDKPTVRVRYSIAERGEPNLATVVDDFLAIAGETESVAATAE